MKKADCSALFKMVSHEVELLVHLTGLSTILLGVFTHLAVAFFKEKKKPK